MNGLRLLQDCQVVPPHSSPEVRGGGAGPGRREPHKACHLGSRSVVSCRRPSPGSLASKNRVWVAVLVKAPSPSYSDMESGWELCTDPPFPSRALHTSLHTGGTSGLAWGSRPHAVFGGLVEHLAQPGCSFMGSNSQGLSPLLAIQDRVWGCWGPVIPGNPQRGPSGAGCALEGFCPSRPSLLCPFSLRGGLATTM